MQENQEPLDQLVTLENVENQDEREPLDLWAHAPSLDIPV